MTASEGKAIFHVPGVAEPCYIWYKVVGDLHTEQTPLVVLHGGPGACHEYLLPLQDLSVPIVFYDQIGNGQSTHLPDKKGDEAFWTVALFCAELDNLLATSDSTVGRSTSSASPGAACWLQNGLSPIRMRHEADGCGGWSSPTRLKAQLPASVRVDIDHAEQTGNFRTPGYEAAIGEFYQRHLSLARPWPAPEIAAAIRWLTEDPTVYGTMYGPSEMTATGSLRDWTIVPELHKITVPTLLVNGDQDEAQDEARDEAMAPFFHRLLKVRWVTIANAAHMSHVDQRERFMEIVGTFLKQNEI
ncbi:Peptidase S33, tricorn interacting factor 1 [Niveomyces insectorum RCEF 264]|uniref:Peptidase S33, tricorn interacting factor 1 n=1 Tax=Niveomyces insectorum RCEF 264 TaxID=1081102 RepID=A0A167TH67_9HYPO|nr:Peptidase S33, tricorn interacting factor 1 [Niveomyces insectorum RCEF 264]